MKLNTRNPFALHTMILQDQVEQEQQDNGAGDATDTKELPNDLALDNFFDALDTDSGINEQKSQLAKPPESTDESTKEDQEQSKEKKPEDQQKQEPENKTDEKPNFERPPSKAKPTKEESIEIVRKQRDELKAKFEELTNGFGDTDPKLLLGLYNQMKDTIEGPLTVDAVGQWLKDAGASKAQIKEIQGQLEEKNKKLIEYDINNSQEFRDKYVQPTEDRFKELFYTFAVPTRNAEGKEVLVAPIATMKLRNLLTNTDPAKLDAPAIAIALREFSAEFKKESGEDAPNVSTGTMLRNLREFQSALGQMNHARKNWEETREKDRATKALQDEQAQEAQKKQSRRERIQHYTTAYKEYDHDSIDGIVDEKVMKKIADEEFGIAEKFFNGEPVLDMVQIAKRGMDAALMTHLRESGQFAEMVEAYKEKLANKEVKGSGGNGGKRPVSGVQGSSFLGDFDLVKQTS